MLTPGALVAVRIEKPAAGGRMIARVGGQVVLVSGAIPGEQLTVRIERVAKGVAFADPISIDEPSADRREPPADPACGGNLFAHIAYPRQLAIKSEIVSDGLSRLGHVVLPAPVAVAGSPGDGYRMRARLHVQQGRIGFFREGSRQLCDPRATGQLLPAANDVIDRLAAVLRDPSLAAVHELELSENLDGSQRAIHLAAAEAIPSRALESVIGHGDVTGVTIGVPGGPGRESVETLWGTPYVTDVLTLIRGPIRLTRHVLAFFQGNRHLLASVVDCVMALAAGSPRVLDLYAGVGLFAVAAVRSHDAAVTAVEGDRQGALDLTANAAVSGGIAVFHESVEAFLARRHPIPDVTIVDPPRTGLSRAALDGLLLMKPPRLIYVSCDIATMARDVRRLVDGGYRVGRTEAFDLFPHTPHIETVMLLTRG